MQMIFKFNLMGSEEMLSISSQVSFQSRDKCTVVHLRDVLIFLTIHTICTEAFLHTINAGKHWFWFVSIKSFASQSLHAADSLCFLLSSLWALFVAVCDIWLWWDQWEDDSYFEFFQSKCHILWWLLGAFVLTRIYWRISSQDDALSVVPNLLPHS